MRHEQEAALPLAFAQVREDPRLDLVLAEKLPAGARVVMVASGGDTAAVLARLPLGDLHLVDMNPAQLALTRLKLHLAEHAGADQAAAVLGHEFMEPSARRQALAEYSKLLDLPAGALGPEACTAEWGPDQSGRYERIFAALRRELRPRQELLEAVLHSPDPAEASSLAASGTPLGRALDGALANTMSLPNLVRMFGQEATQNPARPFHRHFADRIRTALTRFPANTNPFLWQMLAGRFPPGHRCDWLQPENGPSPRRVRQVHWHAGRMKEILDLLPAGETDLIHLSNILDWLSPDQARETFARVHRALRPGGSVILRQLNSTLEMEQLAPGMLWDQPLGEALEAADRSFFYPRILTGLKA